MNIGIAFEGCGCRAAFHVGVMEWLAERGLQPAAVTGASSGSLVAAAVAFGRVRVMRPSWLEYFGTRVFQKHRLLRGRWPFVMTEIVSAASHRHFGDVSMPDTPIPLGIVVTQWRGAGLRRRLITARDPIPVPRAILASCFIPGPYSRMFPIDQRPTFDGAWFARVPIDEMQALGVSRVIACVGDDRGRLLRGVLGRKPMPAPQADYRVLSPVAPLPIGAFDFDPDGTLASFQIGRRSAETFVSLHERWIADAS